MAKSTGLGLARPGLRAQNLGPNPVKHFQNPQKPNRKKVTGLLSSGEAKKSKKIQIVVKQWSNNGQTNYSRILVLLNNYFSFFKFWSNLVKLWSKNGQTNYSRNISVY